MYRAAPLCAVALLVSCSEMPMVPAAPLVDPPPSTLAAELAGHLDPLPETPEVLVCGLVADLDELLEDFGQQVGDFDDDRLNRAPDRARLAVVRARDAAMQPDLRGTIRALKAAMR